MHGRKTKIIIKSNSQVGVRFLWRLTNPRSAYCLTTKGEKVFDIQSHRSFPGKHKINHTWELAPTNGSFIFIFLVGPLFMQPDMKHSIFSFWTQGTNEKSSKLRLVEAQFAQYGSVSYTPTLFSCFGVFYSLEWRIQKKIGHLILWTNGKKRYEERTTNQWKNMKPFCFNRGKKGGRGVDSPG